jgi:hypothetical protein
MKTMLGFVFAYVPREKASCFLKILLFLQGFKIVHYRDKLFTATM